MFRNKSSKDEIITKEFLRIISNTNFIIEKDFNIVLNHRGKVVLIYLGETSEIEKYFNNDSIRSNSYQKRLISISQKKKNFEKKDKVAFINSKFNSFLMIQNSEHIKFQLCHKGDRSTKSLWKLEDYDDINKLNNSSFWISSTSNKKKSIGKLVQNSSESLYIVGVSDTDNIDLKSSMKELKELCISLNKNIVGEKTQLRKKIDPSTFIGKGLLNEILLEAKFYNAKRILFNKELQPYQSKKISMLTNINISDRTDLILEIFEKNAQSKEAHTQIELARLKYELPRLAGQGLNFSQISGGIRSKGPGEKKLEQRRRYLRRRINDLEKQIDNLSNRRQLTRSQRARNQLFSATLIGYTCAGKSTLFNKLTKANVIESTKAFSTLNPTTRKTFISKNTQILLSDTVGFISDLPKDLVSSFRATLEEISDSNLLIHIVDASDKDFEEKIVSVEKTLKETGLEENPKIVVFNKLDLLNPEELNELKKIYPDQCVSSKTGDGINNLKKYIELQIESIGNFSSYKKTANL